MKPWLMLPLLCLLGSSSFAADFVVDCSKVKYASSVPAAAVRADKRACAALAVVPRCERLADEKRLSGSRREQFMLKCEGVRPSRGNARGR